MSSRYSLARDLDEFERMTERLGDYLLGDTLYLSIGGGLLRGGATPQLTIGNLLLRRRRLRELRAQLNDEQDARLSKALARHIALQRDWRLHYGDKLGREVPARLRLLLSFLYDCKENPRGCPGAYPVEALRRTVIAEITLAQDEFAYDAGDLPLRIERVDRDLRNLLQPGPFLWSKALEAIYPREAFWWLHGQPASR